ncbi:hypothetical protein PHMEG_00035334 [Phytophthora megakarya]|uniref:Uncharacterized protein n=1 Tax=Phytophthora megakarya TaxID=4795 RepID=A0A225UNK7_9STRA|nr:hypothetical protein PHMEG_00035334 [Phytophthora megakarya]
MKIHGYSEFDIFANPAVVQNNVRVLYNGYAIFTEGNTDFKYLLVNGAVLETNTGSGGNTTVRCFHTDTFQFDDILHALNDATPIPSASVGTVAVDCPSKHLFKTSFSGAKFAICASGKLGFTAYSSDMTIAVEYLNGPINISMPLSDNTKACADMATSVLMTPTGATLLTGISSYSHSRKLKAEGHMAMEASSCGVSPRLALTSF